jgi:hypothetical protein
MAAQQHRVAALAEMVVDNAIAEAQFLEFESSAASASRL